MTITLRSCLLIGVIWLFSNNVNAQSVQLWDLLFEDVKKSRGTPGACLWEYGMTDTGIYRFSGHEADPAADFSDWSDLYHSWSASVLDSQSLPLPIEGLNKQWSRYFKQDIIPVPALYVIGDKFKRSAIENGLVVLDTNSGKLRLGNVADCFEERHVFLSVPFVQRFYLPDVKLFFSDSFYYTNSAFTLREVQLRLNGGLFVPVKLNQVTQLPLTKGNNALVVKYVLSNGESYYSNVVLYFAEGEESFANDIIRDFKIGDDKRNIYTTPYRRTETGEPLGAYVEVVPGLSNGVPNTCIKKPVIFVEGIDFGYRDHATGCYGGKCGSMGLRDLLRGVIFHPYEKNTSDAFEHWAPIIKAPQLITELRNMGYDLIYLDFHNGADYMENNAMLLVELIKRVNFIKCSNEEIVIIGASMGGQISKFALSYMEKMQMPHCVRNFVAFDSPNQGANIPLGLQHFLKYYKGKLPKIKDQFNRKIDRAASRQLLQAHCLSMDGGGEHGDRVAFTSTLGQLGTYPILCRKIALLNGSINATDLGHAAGEELLKMNPYLGKMNFDILEVSATVWSTYASIEGKNIVLEAQYPLRSKHIVEVPSESLQNDFVPGSLRFDVSEYKAIYGVFNILNRKDVTCFIPSYSALDLYNKDPKFDIAGKLVSDSKNPLYTPFDAFYGVVGQGQEHMMITDENIAWIVHQIEENRDDKPSLLLNAYNMGRESLSTIGNLSISGQGCLYINGSGRNGFGNGRFDQANKPGSHFTAQTSFCKPLINVKDSGRLELGSSSLAGGNKAVLKITKGAILELQKGAILYIHNGSILHIEEGAEMRFHKGAKIVLDGNDAQLQIDGHLIIGDGADFTISGGSTGRTGFVKFRNIGGGFGAARITAIGSQASITLQGTSKSNDRILQIEGHVDLSPQNPLKLFKISYARVAYGDASSLIVNGNADCHHVAFDVLSWAQKHQAKALVLKQFKSSSVRNCDFSFFESGIESFEVNTDAQLYIEACQFKENINGMVLNHSYSNVINTIVREHSDNGIFMLQNCKQLVVTGSHFILNQQGIQAVNSSVFPYTLFVQNSSFSSNVFGVKATNVKATLTCTRMILNDCALSFVYGLLNLSPEYTEYGFNFSLSGGNCTIVESSGSGILVDHTQVFLNNGKNNFIYEGKGAEAGFIKGNVVYSSSTNLPNPLYHLKANQNYWQPGPKFRLEDASPKLYVIKTDFSNSINQDNFLTGSIMTGPNTVCYSGGNCANCEGNNENSRKADLFNPQSVIDIYPQPASNAVFISSDSANAITKLVLRALDGKIVRELDASVNPLVFDVSLLPQGMYMLEIQTHDETIWRPVLIRHF